MTNNNMSFEEFKVEALKRLQKQFLGTDNTKDTVMTRKNIIEMIKDINEMENPQPGLLDTLNTQYDIINKLFNSYNFRDGTSENPYKKCLERMQVIGFEVKLSETPNKYDRVKVYENGHAWLETSGKDFNFNPYAYNVDYNSGIIKFNPKAEGKELIFDYVGTGNVTSKYRIEKMDGGYKDRKDKKEILLLVDHLAQVRTTFDTIKGLLGNESIVRETITDDFGKIETARYDVRIRRISENIRGVRSKGHVIKLTSHRDVLEALGR